MIQITNQNLFGKVIADALSATEQNQTLTSGVKLRWVNAIAKASVKIQTDGVFMDWQENDTLLIWSQGSNEIYEANGVCQCKSFTEFGNPCWHRAASKIIKNYFAELGKVDYAKKPKNSPAPANLGEYNSAPYLKSLSNKTPERIGSVRI